MTTNEASDAVFHALSHSIRRKMLDYVRDEPGLTVGEMAAHFDVSRIAVMNHLTVLERANLLLSERQGRTRTLYMNVMPIQEIHARWTDTYSAYWADGISVIKRAAEAATNKQNEE